MKTERLATPTSRCRVGIAHCDITPPVGIYHPFWGAASHHRATGVHRPITATVLLLSPLEPQADADTQMIVAVDHCMFRPAEMNVLLAEMSQSTGVNTDSITFAFSHTHSAGHIALSRTEMPGGELIADYFRELTQKIADGFRTAHQSLQSASLSYADTVCDMGHNRDCWDPAVDRYVCGLNPEGPTDLPVQTVRITDEAGKLLGTVVNYPCHPTTLAWQNTLISPDYVGALRETVEEATGAPCVFTLAPCGDIGPRHGFVGDVEVADRNGRQVALAALSALESMPEPLVDFHYAGPVVSGATLGSWEYRPFDSSRLDQTSLFRHRSWTVPVAYRNELPSVEQAERERDEFQTEAEQAEQQGDERRARNAYAMVERRRRILERIRPLPREDKYPYAVDVRQLGDAFWISVEGEPYQVLQRALRQRFPETPLVVTTLANGSRPSYLPAFDDYTKPLYQADIAIVAAGSLESVIAEIGEQIERWSRD